MRLINRERIAQRIARQLATLSCIDDVAERYGKVMEVGATALRAHLPGVGLGELCQLQPDGPNAEVVAINGDSAVLSPFGEPVGMRFGALVRPLGRRHDIEVGSHLLGSVLDGLGNRLEGTEVPSGCERRPLEGYAPDPLTRSLIDCALPLGVRAIDGLLTVGRGQRVGIFAGAGVGKSTLLSMLCDGNAADVIVIGLVGERGREVREFLDHVLTPNTRMRTVVVVATSDRSALERLKAPYVATTVAEYFRDQGLHVLLLVDSLTRFARAVREVGLAAGEPAGVGSFPPSLYARLPALLERAGPAPVGSITGLYTVLVQGDDLDEPVADEIRSILDGHIVLSRKLAEAGHYPAIDIGASVSRVMNKTTSIEHRQHALQLRQWLSAYQEIELLVRLGEYEPGQDALADEAMAKRDAIAAFLRQSSSERCEFGSMQAWMSKIVDSER